VCVCEKEHTLSMSLSLSLKQMTCIFLYLYIYIYVHIDRRRPPPVGGVSNVPSLAVEWILVPEVQKLVCLSIFFSLTMRHTDIGRDFSLSHHRLVSLSPQTFLSLTTDISHSPQTFLSLTTDFSLSHHRLSLSRYT